MSERERWLRALGSYGRPACRVCEGRATVRFLHADGWGQQYACEWHADGVELELGDGWTRTAVES